VLPLSLCLVLAAGAIGGALAIRWRATVGVLHGLVGAAALVALILTLGGPPRGVAMGIGSFGRIAAWLLGAALMVGLGIVAVRFRRRRVPAFAIGVHATIAISGIVMLAAYTLV
jgi:hypothetical protein